MRGRGGFGRGPRLRPRLTVFHGRRLWRPFWGMGCLTPLALLGIAIFVIVFILPGLTR